MPLTKLEREKALFIHNEWVDHIRSLIDKLKNTTKKLDAVVESYMSHIHNLRSIHQKITMAFQTFDEVRSNVGACGLFAPALLAEREKREFENLVYDYEAVFSLERERSRRDSYIIRCDHRMSRTDNNAFVFKLQLQGRRMFTLALLNGDEASDAERNAKRLYSFERELSATINALALCQYFLPFSSVEKNGDGEVVNRRDIYFGDESPRAPSVFSPTQHCDGGGYSLPVYPRSY